MELDPELLKQAQWTPMSRPAFDVPSDQHGWRGLSLPGNQKRKVYTVLHNEQVLVTCLLLFPGERSVRHSHESGELSVHFDDAMKPVVSWHPPGEVHGGAAPRQLGKELADLLRQVPPESVAQETARAITELVPALELPQVEEWIQALVRPAPAPRVLIDILFPPFRTTIEDPTLTRTTFVGQWYD